MQDQEGADLDLVARAYGVLAGESDWSEVMRAFNARFELTYSMIATQTRGATLLNAGVHSARREAVTEVIEYWGRHDTRTPRYLGRTRARKGQLVSDAALFEPAELARSPLHHDYFRPRGADDFVGMSLRLGADDYFFLGGLPIGCAPPEDEDADRLVATTRHLMRAAELWSRGNRHRIVADIAARGAGRPAVLIDTRGRWSWLGEQDAGVLSGHLRVVDGVPHFADRRAWTGLLDSLDRASDGADTTTLALDRPPASPLVLVAHLVDVDPIDPLATGDVAAILTLHDTMGPPARPDEALRALGLTAAEARLAARVGRAMSPAEAAAELGISLTTARGTLAGVYTKLGIGRQAELVRLVTLVLH